MGKAGILNLLLCFSNYLFIIRTTIIVNKLFYLSQILACKRASICDAETCCDNFQGPTHTKSAVTIVSDNCRSDNCRSMGRYMLLYIFYILLIYTIFIDCVSNLNSFYLPLLDWPPTPAGHPPSHPGHTTFGQPGPCNFKHSHFHTCIKI